MRVVEVRVSRAAFADVLGAMRDWLDRNGRPLVRFDTATEDDTIMIRVEFDAEDLAEAFRREFGDR